MRSKPSIILQWSNRQGDEHVEITEAEQGSCWALCLVDANGPRVVRVRVPTDRGNFKYPTSSHPAPGHATNLADRCNARFKLEPHKTSMWFEAWRMAPVEPASGDPMRKGGASSATKRRINRPKP